MEWGLPLGGREKRKLVCPALSKFAKPAFIERTLVCTCLGQWKNCGLEQAMVLVVWFGRLCLRIGQMEILQLLQMKFFCLLLSTCYSYVLGGVEEDGGPALGGSPS